jgi:tRNA threonylcarbamoyladenosine biosynthesis protein TsaE
MDSHTAIVGTPAQPWLGTWRDEAETEAFAQRLAQCPAVRNATLALHGDLGAGKTTFVRHLLRALGVSGRIKSPTYAVVEPHTAPGLSIWHFDFYRFSDPREWEDAGFRELFASPGLKLVEWPQNAGEALPLIDLDLWIEGDEVGLRRLRASARTPVGRTLIGHLPPHTT